MCPTIYEVKSALIRQWSTEQWSDFGKRHWGFHVKVYNYTIICITRFCRAGPQFLNSNWQGW